MIIHTSVDDTGRRRPIEYHKLQVILRKRATNYRALLRTINYECKAFYDSTPPCMHIIYECEHMCAIQYV